MIGNKSLLRRTSKSNCFTASVAGQDLTYLGFKVLCLEQGEEYHLKTSNFEEGVCILISGKIEIQADKTIKTIERDSPFMDLPSGIFLSKSCETSLYGIGDQNVLAIATAQLDPLRDYSSGGDSYTEVFPDFTWIEKDSIVVLNRGVNSYQRTIRNVIGPDFPARSLICGETINPPGHWSSFPPHKHDLDSEDESAHEELYLYLFDPSQGWAYQEVYSSEHGFQEVFRVENGDVVLIPFGYHPVTSAPGYSLCYLWFLAGFSRNFKVKEDPRHLWINNL